MPTYQTTRISASKPARANVNINQIVESLTVSVALVTNDLIEFATVPKNAIITDLRIGASASLGGTASMIVGDAGDPDRLLTSTAMTAAGVFRLNAATGLGYRYSAETKLYMTASSIATGTTGTVLTFVLQYQMDY
jgi:hypothetical protein